MMTIMRVLVVSQYFWPEDFRINGVANTLLDKGVEVEVLTGKPNYPRGKTFDGYKVPGCQQEGLSGVYHVAALPISKYDLLQLVAKTYGKSIITSPAKAPVVDRSLNAGRFKEATGYVAPEWPALVRRMYEFK